MHLSTSLLLQKRPWSYPVDVIGPLQWPGDRNIHVCLSSWQTVWLPWLHFAAFLLYPRRSQALAPELKAPGHTKAEQPRQSCSWHQGKLFAPRGKHSRGSVQCINPSLLCYKRPYCRNTNHSEMACTMSNHLIATEHTLGIGPKLFTGGRQGRIWHIIMFASCSSPSYHGRHTSFEQVDSYNTGETISIHE